MNKNLKYLFTLLMATATAGCIKTDLEEQETPASLPEVQNAIASAWGEADPMTMAVGDFLFQETEQRLNSGVDPFYTLQEGISISKLEELETSYQFTYLHQTREYKNGQEGALSTRETTRTVGKGVDLMSMAKTRKPSEISVFADDHHMNLGFEKVYSLLFACEQTPELTKYCRETLKVDSCQITCSNLKTSEAKAPVPEAISKKPNCGGFADCQYTEKSVAFDWQVTFTTGGTVETQRINYSLTVSPDLPFFTRLTNYCNRQLVPIQGTQLLVDTCTHLRNFSNGQP